MIRREDCVVYDKDYLDKDGYLKKHIYDGIVEAEEDIENGRVVDAFEALEWLREKYVSGRK